VTLEDQDRARGDAGTIAEGVRLLEAAQRQGRPGPYQLQAAIAACHATAPTAADTDWAQVAALYGQLSRLVPSGVVKLNLAVAVGMRQAPGWPGMEALAPTLAYDAGVMGDSLVPTDLVAAVEVPTLVLDGSETGAWAANSARALSATLPNPRQRTLEGQTHAVAWDVLAPVLKEFFTG
jgi:pimeloyl-ACP methyl ester carboxylesterase